MGCTCGPAGRTARAAAGWLLFGFVLLYGLLVIGGGFPLHKRDGAGGAGGQAIAQAVTVIVPQQPGFAGHHADGAFVACFGTQAAAVAFVFIDLYDLANHRQFLRIDLMNLP